MSSNVSTPLSLRSPLLYIGLVLAISLGVSSYAWYDHLVAHDETVAGNVLYAGERLDGATREEVRTVVSDRKSEILNNPVVIRTPEGPITMRAGDVGFGYDTNRAMNRVFSARHVGGPIDQFSNWIGTLTSPEKVEDPVTFNEAEARAALERTGLLVFEDPVEPDMEMNEAWRLVVSPGEPGQIADLEDLVAQLEELDPVAGDLEVTSHPTALPPRFTDEDVGALVDHLNEVTKTGARLKVGGEIRQISPAALRRHLTISTEGPEIQHMVDLAGFQTELEKAFPDAVGLGQDPVFIVDDGEALLQEPGVATEKCCDPGAAETVANAILEGGAGPFVVRTRPEDDPDRIAWYDGSLIVEQVSTFTTPHNCCESRVTNIQRIADIVRGAYLVPGEIISLNEYVGPRTTEKGFVPAGAIRKGRLTPEVGGGVSQFATTIFNAAYFAGLDFIEYRAHSQYFSRYPYGREATISNPAPDLVFQNTTEFPILIWTSYTSRSITVSMYSTKNIEAEQVATRSSKRNQCTYVETDRLRTYADGREVVDTFWALYRPANGIDCNGNPIPE